MSESLFDKIEKTKQVKTLERYWKIPFFFGCLGMTLGISEISYNLYNMSKIIDSPSGRKQFEIYQSRNLKTSIGLFVPAISWIMGLQLMNLRYTRPQEGLTYYKDYPELKSFWKI